MGNVEFHVEGGSEAAEELRILLKSELAAEPTLRKAEGGSANKDPVAIAALILSIPGAVLATMDLAQRLKLVEKVRRVIAWAGERRKKDGTRILVSGDSGKALPLDELQPSDLLDLAHVPDGKQKH